MNELKETIEKIEGVNKCIIVKRKNTKAHFVNCELSNGDTFGTSLILSYEKGVDEFIDHLKDYLKGKLENYFYHLVNNQEGIREEVMKIDKIVSCEYFPDRITTNEENNGGDYYAFILRINDKRFGISFDITNERTVKSFMRNINYDFNK